MFGPIPTHWDAFGRVRKQLEAFGRFRKFLRLGGLVGTHRELSKRSLRVKKRPVRAKNGQIERKKGQFERKNDQVERKGAFEVPLGPREGPSGLPKNFKSARRRQLRASKSVMRAAKGRRSPRRSSVISRWIRCHEQIFEIFTILFSKKCSKKICKNVS